MMMGGMPLIVDIKRHSLEDGPGIRSVVFFKGCPLRCVFCHNPEAQEPSPEIAYYQKECVHCAQCVDACPRDGIDLERSEGIIDRARCDSCGECVDACPGSALRKVGSHYSIDELLEILARDRAFYAHSGGGVTLSGGECTLYPEYLEQLLQGLRAQGIHLAIETSGAFNFEVFAEKILPYVDLIYFDLKFADRQEHLSYTGKTNSVIIENFKRLTGISGVQVVPRIPLVPRLTATEENLEALADLLREEHVEKVELLGFNPMGREKQKAIGKCGNALPQDLLSPEEESRLREVFQSELMKA